MNRIKTFSLLLLINLVGLLQADDSPPPQVLLAPADMSPVPASLADIDWIVGAWEGKLGDAMQEHIAYPPVAGQIPGFVRAWTNEDAITFYEINAFAEVDNTLEFRVKHFSPDLAGWEPQGEFVRHRLVAKTADALFFDGITFVRSGPERHTVYYRIPAGDRLGEIVTVQQRRRPSPPSPAPGAGEVVTLQSTSAILRENRIGLSAERSHRVYLPPSYATSPGRRYPVVHFCHNFYSSPAQVLADGQIQRLLEQAFAEGGIGEFILVVADYTSPTTGSLYENSPTSGRWLDYTVDEIVPLIDRAYRTLPHRDSRAVIGAFFGGRGALALGMRHADTFGTVYAMHPVATGNGDLPWDALGMDWRNMHAATSFEEVLPGGRERIFIAISQGFLPNADRPPFYCDFPVELVDGEPRAVPDNVRKAQQGFLLDETLDASTENLRSLRGLALDWGRFDPTQAHVITNRQFSRKLADLGIPHEAEEFAGGVWDRAWTDDGRFATRVLPFLDRHLRTGSRVE